MFFSHEPLIMTTITTSCFKYFSALTAKTENIFLKTLFMLIWRSREICQSLLTNICEQALNNQQQSTSKDKFKELIGIFRSNIGLGEALEAETFCDVTQWDDLKNYIKVAEIKSITSDIFLYNPM